MYEINNFNFDTTRYQTKMNLTLKYGNQQLSFDFPSKTVAPRFSEPAFVSQRNSLKKIC
jgi:hypothetical protein